MNITQDEDSGPDWIEANPPPTYYKPGEKLRLAPLMSDQEVITHHATRYRRMRMGLPESPTVSCDLESESEIIPRNLQEGFDDEGNLLADEKKERYSVWRERYQKWKGEEPKIIERKLKPHNLTEVEYEIDQIKELMRRTEIKEAVMKERDPEDDAREIMKREKEME